MKAIPVLSYDTQNIESRRKSGNFMEENKRTFKSIDEYISLFPPGVREILETLRKVIKESAPEAEEKISYQMPHLCIAWEPGTFCRL